MEQKRNSLGQFLQTAREQKGLTLRAVEKATGISNAYLSQLESGKIQQPSPKNLHKLSELYQVSYIDIMRLAGYPVPEESGKETPNARLVSRIGPISKKEEDELVEYLEFMRSKRRQGRRR